MPRNPASPQLASIDDRFSADDQFLLLAAETLRKDRLITIFEIAPESSDLLVGIAAE